MAGIRLSSLPVASTLGDTDLMYVASSGTTSSSVTWAVVKSYMASATVSDTAYNATTWDGVTTIAPSKNAIRDLAVTLVTLTGSETLTNKVLTAPDINAGTVDSVTSLSLRSTGAAFDLTFASSEVLTAGRTLSFVMGDAARTLTLSGNPTLGDWFDQSVKTGASPTFVNVTANLTGNITGTAPAGTLTGATLASGVTASSLTSLGTIAALSAGTGSFSGNVTLSSGSGTANILHGGTAGRLILDGDSGGAGAELILYGSTHATQASKSIAGASSYTWQSTAGTNAMTYIPGTSLTVAGSITAGADSITGGAISGTTGTFSSTLTSTGTTPTHIIGNQASAGAGAQIKLVPSSTQTNWMIGANQTVAGVFEITPSTAGGGTTFTTPVIKVDTSGGNGVWGATTPAAGSFTTLNLNAAGYWHAYNSDATNEAYLHNGGATGANNGNLIVEFTNAGEVARFSNTGLAVTGTLSTTDDVTITAATPIITYVNTASSNKTWIAGMTSGTQYRISESGVGDALVISAGGGAAFSSTLSATSNVKISTNNVYFQGVTTAAAAQNLLGIGGDDNTYVFCKPTKKVTVYGTATIADFSDTGLAVTGTLSTTGVVKFGGATAATGTINADFAGATDGMEMTVTDATSGANFIVFRKSDGTAIGYINRVTTTDAVAYNTTSDGRLKTDIEDFLYSESGRLVDSLHARWFKWRNHNGRQEHKGVAGFIAQEAHAADPIFARIGAVTVGDEGDEIKKGWAMDHSKLVPILWTEVRSLRARLAAAGIA